MGGQSLSFWFRADITLLLKSDYTTTATYKLTNREVFNTEGTVYYPLISALNDIGTQLSNNIPAEINSMLVALALKENSAICLIDILQ